MRGPRGASLAAAAARAGAPGAATAAARATRATPRTSSSRRPGAARRQAREDHFEWLVVVELVAGSVGLPAARARRALRRTGSHDDKRNQYPAGPGSIRPGVSRVPLHAPTAHSGFGDRSGQIAIGLRIYIL